MKFSGLSGEHPSEAELRTVRVFEDLPAEQIEWLSSHMQVFELGNGAVLAQEGDPAEEMIVFFRGELQAERKNGSVFVAPAGEVSGLLPYSQMTNYGFITARGDSRGAILHKDNFAEMLQQIPILNQRLVGVLKNRVREDASVQQQNEKLMALGRMSAGLAHELNNPAAAAQRAADSLRQRLETMQRANLALEERGIPSSARLFLAKLEWEWARNICTAPVLDTLDRSEREEEFADWLEAHRVEKAWEFSASLVDAGCTTVDDLDNISREVPEEALEEALDRVTASFTATRLVEEIQSSMSHISGLLRSIKEYSYMDQAPKQTVDIHDGLESTLIMLKHRLKEGIEVKREYDRSIPKLYVHGSQLNQVWTNLIGNAADAMHGKGKLTIQTSRADHNAFISITDSGPGIPPDVQTRIFEPFFTTKPIGEGTGQGLDVSRRIVVGHSGEISFKSQPGQTTFTVRLPIKE